MTPAPPAVLLARDLLPAAHDFYDQIIEAQAALERDRDLLLDSAWRLGRVLSQIKDSVGHGNYLFWLGQNWPELVPRNASRYLTFFRENPNRWNSTDLKPSADFTVESVRKFMWDYIPAKQRAALPGDETVKRAPHHLTYVNSWSKFDRQLGQGLIKADIDDMRRDLEPVVRRQIELFGRPWFESLLKE